ncbi:MAG: TonB-dependent receptor [Thalassobius sp.]|nr:TonB-dependent receptor [Thalassovita sp.]
MNRILLLAFFIFQCSLAFSQETKEIVILNNFDQEPVEGVVIRAKSQPSLIAVSNRKGQVNIERFNTGETLVITHVGFATKTIKLSEIIAGNGTLTLEESLISLEEVLLSANKFEQEKKYIPNQIIGIQPKDIAFKNPQTTADVLQQTGYVFMQKSQLGGGSPMIRGFAANSLLIVLDGVRMNNAIYRSGNLQNLISLDANILESAEVVFGPGSVMYGSDALGGVMDFHTRTPEYSNIGKLHVEGSALARYSTANNENTGHFDINLSGKRWSLLSSATYSDFDDLRSGGNRPDDYADFGKRLEYVVRVDGEDQVVTNDDYNVQKFSGYNQLNLTNKLGFKASEYVDFTYSFHYSKTSDVPRYDRLIQRRSGALRYAEWYYSPQTWQLHALKADIKKKTALFERLKNTFAYQKVEEGRNDRSFGSANLRQRVESVDVFSWNLDAEKGLADEKVELYYGVEVVHNKVNSTGHIYNIETQETTPTSTRYPSGGSDLTNGALYASAKYFFNSKLTFSAGIRANYVSLSAVFDDKSFYPFPYDETSLNTGSINGSLGLTYRPDNKTQYNFNMSSGFRAPNIDDVGKVFDSGDGIVVVPNPDLKPENSYNIEGGISKALFNKVKFDVTVFYSYLTDAMVRRAFSFNGQDSILYDGELSEVQAETNTGKAYILGASTSLSYEISRNFSLRGTYNYIYGKDKIDNVPLRHVSPEFGQISLMYKNKNLLVELFSDYNGWMRFEDLAPSEVDKDYLYTEDGTPSWVTFNARASYRFINGLFVQAALENITDLHYRPYSSGISAAGRNFIISARYNF